MTDAPVTTTLAVRGMTCEHCVMSVTEELSDVAGVTDVSVDLVEGGDSAVHVTATMPLDPDAVRAAVTEAGYTLAP